MYGCWWFLNVKQINGKQPKSIATFGLAINQGKDDYVEFIDILVDSYMIESVEKYLQKGDKVAVVGRFANRSYTAKDGTKRTSPTIYAESLEYIDVFAIKTVEPKDETKEEPKEEPKQKPKTNKPKQKPKTDKPRRK